MKATIWFNESHKSLDFQELVFHILLPKTYTCSRRHGQKIVGKFPVKCEWLISYWNFTGNIKYVQFCIIVHYFNKIVFYLTHLGVVCGKHVAKTCEECPIHNGINMGSSWCNGECIWKDGICQGSMNISHFKALKIFHKFQKKSRLLLKI